MGNLVSSFLYLAFWELLLVGVPVAVAAIAAWLWWRRLPHDERGGRVFGKRSKASRGSGGFSFLFTIVFIIKVYLDGRWNIPIGTWTLDYVVGSVLTILVWGLIVFAIPATIALAWWIRHEMRKP
jgi:hypothetical protein